MEDAGNAVYNTDEQRWANLMVAAQGGDAPAYRQLLEELGPVMERYVASRVGQHEFLEDVVQDALLAIHQARHTYRPGHRFRPWLFAIVRNKTIDYLRRNRTRDRFLARERADSDAQGEPQAAATPEVALDHGKLMKALSQPHREALTLTRIIGLSNAEAAHQLKISEGAVKVRVHRALGRLRRLMEAEA